MARVDLMAVLMGLVFVTIWASAFTSARIAVAYAPPFLLLALRFALSGGIAIVAAWALGQALPRGAQQWRSIVLFGLCQNTLYLGLNFVAMQWVEASVAVVIASTLPLLVAAAGRMFLSERLPLLGTLGLVAGFAGVLVVMAGRVTGGLDPLGLAFCIAGVLALTSATLLLRGASSSGNLLMVVGLQMAVGSATLLPLSIAFEQWQVNLTVPLIAAFAYTTLFPGLAATLIWFALVRRIGMTRAASFHFLNPPIGVGIAAVVLGEPISALDFFGVAIVAVGIVAVQRARQ